MVSFGHEAREIDHRGLVRRQGPTGLVGHAPQLSLRLGLPEIRQEVPDAQSGTSARQSSGPGAVPRVPGESFRG